MSSTLYTIGTALSRAKDHAVVVRVLVAGQWIEGLVSDVDGHGVVLTGSGTDHHVVRVNDISAVRVHAQDPLGDTEPSRSPTPAATRRARPSRTTDHH